MHVPTPRPHPDDAASGIPQQSLWALFLRFLRFGALAWGGPVAQIGMLRQALVEQERWIPPAQFNRALALYQVLPGPEAHELCVYFGLQARGRIGGVVAGLGFMLPGFVLMLVLAWWYVRHGLQMAALDGVLAAVQAVVAALIARAVVRIGGHVLVDRGLWVIAVLALGAHLAGVHFAVVLLGAGVLHVLAQAGWRRSAACLAAAAGIAIAARVLDAGGLPGFDALSATAPHPAHALQATSVLALFGAGLQAGLLTFGGAYTVIPFLQRDAVVDGAWMSNAQFLDGLALSGLLPAPAVIVATFVGYIGGGLPGALAMTAGVFGPAFALTVLGHDALERLVQRPRVHAVLDGVTAGVVGLIAGTTLALMRASLGNVQAGVLFALALAVLFATRARLVIPMLVLGAAVWGWLQP